MSNSRDHPRCGSFYNGNAFARSPASSFVHSRFYLTPDGLRESSEKKGWFELCFPLGIPGVLGVLR